MRIGIYDPYLDTMSGGEKYMLSLAKCLAKKYTVDIFWDTSKKEEIVDKAKKRFAFDLSEFTFVPSLFTPDVSFVTRFMESRIYDHIIILSDGSLPFLGCPTTIHFQSPVEWVDLSFKSKVKMARIKHVVCNSQFTKSYIDKKFKIKSTVIYPPIALPEKKGIKKTNNILHVGRYGINNSGSSYKKQEVLADVFKSMVDQGLKDWELVFVVSLREEDKEKLAILQNETKEYPVRYVINPTNSALWEEYEKAKIYWHASGFGEDLKTHPDRAEHFGMSTVEAMGMGAIPIVINAGGQKEIVQHGENGYVWNTKEELIHYTTHIIEDQKDMKHFAGLAEASAEKYSLKSFCQSFIDLV